MTNERIDLGKKGEDLAVVYLKKNGYKILDRNVRTAYGEIDIVAKERKTFCFVEVKMRGSDSCGSGLESITARKQKKIADTALFYLQEKNLEDAEMRFDVISIDPDENGFSQIDFIKSAFDVEIQ
jgi:putative endonuclease